MGGATLSVSKQKKNIATSTVRRAPEVYNGRTVFGVDAATRAMWNGIAVQPDEIEIAFAEWPSTLEFMNGLFRDYYRSGFERIVTSPLVPPGTAYIFSPDAFRQMIDIYPLVPPRDPYALKQDRTLARNGESRVPAFIPQRRLDGRR